MTDIKKVKRVYIDFESRSPVDIWSAGAWVYSEHPNTEILCLCYAVDDGPVITLTRQNMGAGIIELDKLNAEGAEFHAHNAYFERCMWRNKLETRYLADPIPLKQWRCTAAKCSAHALPRSLENAALALNCIHKKDKKGSMTMRAISKTTGLIEQAPLDRLYKYCAQDVEVEREIDKRLPDLCPSEQKVWFLDQHINDVGVGIDVPAARNAVRCIEKEVAELTREIQVLSGGEINAGTQRDAIKNYLEKKGIKLPDLTKKTVVAALEKAGGDNMRILQLRQQLSLTSNAKYKALLDTVSSDGRIRDILVYHGASTGRWSGKLVQIQNLPKPSDAAFDNTFPCRLLHTDPASFETLYAGDILSTLSSCIRGMFIPTPGYEMFTTDFAAIEARVVMWLAGENAGLNLFTEQDINPEMADIYVQMARAIYNKKTLTKKDKKERQLGKQAVLGCIAEDSMVYSDKGFIPIQTLKQGQRLWNGEKWVNFRELAATGKKNVIQIGGLWLTPDHLLLTQTGWQTAAEIALNGDTQPLQLGSYSGDGQLLAQNTMLARNAVSLSAVNAVLRKLVELTNFGEDLQNYVDSVIKVLKDKKAVDPVSILISSLIRVCAKDGACAGTIFYAAAANQIIRTSRGMVLVGFGCPLSRAENSWNTLLRSLSGISGGTPWIELIMPKGTQKEISESLHKEKTIETKIKECWDVVDVETASFQTEKFITHNCGFGMGAVKFKATCANYNIEIDDNLAQRAVNAYRTTFKKVVKFWYEMEAAAIQAVNEKKPIQVNRVLWYLDDEFLRMKLPGGRTLAYHRPKVDAEGKLSYMAVNSVTHKYLPERTWGGTLVENATQAVARDLMKEPMLQMASSGFRILFTVHDELVVEAPKGTKTEADILKAVRTVPSWAAGCPINAECEKVERYKK